MNRGPYNAERFWFSVEGERGLERPSGWCFGKTPEQALESAVMDVKRWHPECRGKKTVHLKQDVEHPEYTSLETTI